MSFCSDTKEVLCDQKIKKTCCKMAILYGMFYPLSDVSAGKMKFSTDIDAVKKLFGCKNADELKTVLPNFTSGNLNRGIK